MEDIVLEPLSEKWQEELKQLKNNKNIDKSLLNRMNDYIAILHTQDVLILAFQNRLNKKKMKFYKSDSLEWISYYFAAHSYNLSHSIYNLTKLGYASGSAIIVRTIVEIVIDFAYLWLCKKINNSEDERMAWIEFDSIRQNQILNKWQDMQKHRKQKGFNIVEPEKIIRDLRAEEIEQEVGEFNKKYKRKHWAYITTLEDRARKIDDTQILQNDFGVLEEAYQICYRWTSGMAHGESISAKNYFERSEKEGSIIFGPNYELIDAIVAMASRFVLCILHMVNHINHINLDILAQLEKSGCLKYGNNV